MPRRPPNLKAQAQPSRRQWRRPKGGTTTQRGYGWAWQKLRARILARDKGLCQPCLKLGRPVAARDVDHVVPKHRGGTDDDTNLQSLCGPCHDAKTAKEGRAAQPRPD